MTVSFKFLFITFALCGLLSHRILFHIPPAPMVYYLASLYSRCIFISFNHRWENRYFFTNHVSKLNFLLFLYSLSYIFSVLLISLSVLYFITIDHHILFHCLFYSALQIIRYALAKCVANVPRSGRNVGSLASAVELIFYFFYYVFH